MNIINFKSRRNKIKELLSQKECILFHTRDYREKGDDEFFHSIDSNFRYFFSDIKIPAIGCIYLENDLIIVKLGIQKRSPIEEKFMGKIDIENISKDSEIPKENILYFDNLIHEIKKKYSSLQFSKINYCYEENRNYFSNFKALLNELKDELKLNAIVNYFDEIKQFRMIKEDIEIEYIKKANDIAKNSFEYVLSKIKESKNEQEVFAHLSFKTFFQHSTHAFYPIIAAGKNATTLHYNSHNSTIKDSDLILIDFGCEYEGYCSDITRVFPKSGTFSKREKEIYQAVLDVQKYAISILQPKLLFKEYEIKIRKFMAQELVKLNLISQKELDEKGIECIKKYYPHSTSHSLGLDTHDCCNYSSQIQEGMVLTVEPGIYIEEENIGIRIEDNVVITKNGCENLSKDIIKEIHDIEEHIKKS